MASIKGSHPQRTWRTRQGLFCGAAAPSAAPQNNPCPFVEGGHSDTGRRWIRRAGSLRRDKRYTYCTGGVRQPADGQGGDVLTYVVSRGACGRDIVIAASPVREGEGRRRRSAQPATATVPRRTSAASRNAAGGISWPLAGT